MGCHLALGHVIAILDEIGISTIRCCFFEDNRTLPVVSEGAVAIFIDTDVPRIEVSNGDTFAWVLGLISHLAAGSTLRQSRGSATDVSIPRKATALANV